ncbi:uncharacterized protein [Atheta coriaria]|uniref:uncharacterized protein n=1 Tax=Dalotia coriaria TaxID=877792 RepID=UPI0031F4367E
MDADLFACRLCSNTEELVDVGDKKTQFAAEYRNIVKIMTGIKIKPNDKLSSICRSCLKRAIENYDYRRSAIQRNAELTKKREELENRIKEDEEAVKILTGEVSSTDNKTNSNVFDENTEDESDEVEFVSISLDITSKETATTSSACASATQTKPEQIVSPDANQNCDNNQRVEDSHTETETVNEEMTASPAVDGNILLIHNTNTENVATKTVKHVDFPPTDGNIGLCNNDNTETEFVVRKSVKRAASLAADDNIVLCKEDEAFDDDTSSSESITTEKQLHPSLKRIINQYPNIRLPASVYKTTFPEVRVELTHDAVKRQIVKLKRRFRRGYKKKVKIPTSPRDLPIQRLEIPDVMPTTSKELKELVTSSLGLQRTGPETPQKTPAISISLPTLTISHVDVIRNPESIEKTPEKSWNNRLGFTTPIDTEYSQLRLSPTEFLDTIDDENEDVDMTAAGAEEECNPGDYSLIKVADEETIYICDQCHKVFQKKSNFNRHKLIHLRCVFCGVRCLSKENLQAHVRTKCPKRTRKVSVRLVPMERDAKVKHLLPSTFFKEINKEKDAEVAELPVVNDNYSAFDVALQYFRNDNNDELSDVESIHLLKEDDAESGEVRLESIEEDEEAETTPVIEENSTDVDTVEAETAVIKHDVSYGVDFEETATSVIFGDAQDYEAEAAPALRVTDGSNVNQLQMDEAFHIQRLSQGCKQSDTHTTAQVQVTPKDFIAIENSGQALFIKGLANVPGSG